MIDYIKNNFKEGDYLSITGSGSRISGYLVHVDDNLVVLRSLSGEIEGMKSGAIVSFSSKQRDKYSNRNKGKIKNRSEEASEPLFSKPNFSTNEPQEESFRRFKPGDKIPLDELAHRDPTLAQNWRIRDENKARAQAVQERLLNVLSEAINARRDEDEVLIKPMGQVVELQPGFHFGFIDDLQDGQRYFFNKFDLIDPELKNLQGKDVEVIYLRSTNKKGVAAKCIHRPATIAQLTTLIKSIVVAEDLQNAKSVVEMILQVFPENITAQTLLASFQATGSEGSYTEEVGYTRDEVSNMYAYYKEGKRMLAGKDQRGAIQAFQTALDSGYRKASCIKDIAQAYITLYAGSESPEERKKVQAEALNFMKEYENDLPRNQSTLFTLENFYFALGAYLSHIDIVEQIITECGRTGELAQYVFYLNKAAQSYLRLGELDKALDAATQGLEVEPEHPHLLKTQHSILEARKGEAEAAISKGKSDDTPDISKL